MADSEGGGRPEGAEQTSDALGLDLDELDDAEFDIPIVSVPPSLESILNDDEGPDSDPEEGHGGSQAPFLLVPEGGLETSSLTSRGSSEGRSRAGSRGRRASPLGRATSTSGNVLRHVVLKGLTTQINAAAERSGAGTATAACGGGGCVCVGTSHGAVLVFDATQKLRFLLEAAEGAGAVSCLAASGDGGRLLVGHDKGLLCMYDLRDGRLLRTLPDAHAPSTAILHVKFTDSSALALCSDSGGSVFELAFKRVLGVRGCDARCLFSGARGEVVALEPLLLAPFGQHPLDAHALLAMATLSKVIVVQTRPRTRVVLTHPLPARPDSLPLLAWQMVLIQVADHSRVVDPVLAFGRDRALFFYQVGVDGGGRARATLLHRSQLSFQMLSLHWLNARTLAVLDTREHVHVIDVRSQTEVETLDVSSARLVFASSHFKAIATGGNVSKALALAGERACYNTVVSLGQQLLLVGTRSVHALHMRTWNERVDHVARQGRPLAALELGLAFYEERAKAVVGLRGPKAHRRQIIKDKIFHVLDAFVDKMVSSAETSADELRETFAAAANYCVLLDRRETLFGRYWEAASGRSEAEAAFLEALEPHILNDELQAPPPSIMQHFVLHYERVKRFQALEACLVHVDVCCLDIHQTMTLCWQHNLFDAILSVHTRGMLDYVTPLVELLTVLQAALSTGKQLSEQQVTLGNKLLVYVSCCLAGRAYPRRGDVPPELQAQVKHELLKCLTTLHSRAPTDSEPPYPYLRVFLQFDTREFLNVLALAFEEPEFSSELGLRQRQRIVDILLQIVVPGETFSASQVGALFTFLARQLARPGAVLMVEPHLFHQVVDFLTTPLDAVAPLTPGGQHEERQQALMELLMAPQGLQLCDDEDLLLQKAYTAKFFRVCEFLHLRRKEYIPILDCYLQDPFRRGQVFTFLRNLLVNPGYLESQKTRQLVLDNIKELVEIDSKKVGQLVSSHLPSLVHPVLEQLKEEPESLFNFLQGLFLYREGHAGAREEPLSPEVHETFLLLMCKLRPSDVAAHVRADSECRLEQALQVVREFGQVEAEAHLMERAGDVTGAFDLLKKQFERELLRALESEGGEAAWSLAQARLLLAVQLGQRGVALLDESAREALWFPLLQLLMRHRAANSQKPQHHNALRDMCQHVLSSMLGHVSLPAVTRLMLQEPSFGQGKFGEVRDLLLSMLRGCEHEERVLRTTQRILNADLHARLAKTLRRAQRPLAPHPAGVPVPASAPPLCARCDAPLLRPNAAPAVVFSCGHALHCSCAGGGGPECPLCNPGSAPLAQQSPSKVGSAVKSELQQQEEAAAAWRRQRRQQLSPQEDALVLNLAPPPGHAYLQGLF